MLSLGGEIIFSYVSMKILDHFFFQIRYSSLLILNDQNGRVFTVFGLLQQEFRVDYQ